MSGDVVSLFGEPSDDGDETNLDISGANMFTEELENINTSDWDIDSGQLWGDDGEDAAIDVGDGAVDSDFPT